jgi:hypothetical protein
MEQSHLQTLWGIFFNVGINLLGQPMGIDQNLGYARLQQLIKPNSEQRLAINGQQAFWRCVG